MSVPKDTVRYCFKNTILLGVTKRLEEGEVKGPWTPGLSNSLEGVPVC